MLLTERVSDVLLAAGSPTATALVEGDRTLTHGDLLEAVADRGAALDLPDRSLVLLRTSNSVEFVVTYLALLDGGHVPLLAGEHGGSLAEVWEPDAVVATHTGGWSIEHRRRTRDRELHPDLALLLSTSGSTGAPKLVRLSHGNLASNASAIIDYLGLSSDDRGITSLPLHYCYGLSVLHSHLAAGAGMVMTTTSVVDPCFAAALRDGDVTNVAGVPHTFELLDQAGPDRVHVPTLRFMTQAGGRMDPDRVRAWLDRTAGWGVDFFVMYGQTEATARMAYLPPELARRHPTAIGRPIPGGHMELREVGDAPDDVGEIVYRGPNVMLGYATQAADLALGATLDELATGDLGRVDPTDGVFEVVGRRSRFVKPFGLRIDLDAVEAALATGGIDAVATGDDERLVVCAPDRSPDDVRVRLGDLTGLPARALVIDTAAVPRTAAGKVDHATLLGRAPAAPPTAPGESAGAIFALVLGRSDVSAGSTFVGLGGDSLSYVECSVLLEERLGRLPPDWHLRRVDELDALGGPSGLPRLDTTALVRAVGILLVVSTHMRFWHFPGGAHLMLGAVGYNASRFLFCIDGPVDRLVAVARSIARLAVPVVAFVGACMLLVGGYSLPTLALVNGYLGPASHLHGRWHYWFIEVVVQLLVLATVMLAIGPVRRLERRFTYTFPLVLFGATLVLRELWVGDNLRYQLHGVAWFFVLGWLVHRATTLPTKVLTTALCVVTVPGFFGQPGRELLIAAGLVLLVWCREVPMPRFVLRPVAAVAAASMAIYVSHFRIWPVFDRNLPGGWAYVATVAVGVAIWIVGERALRHLRRRSGAVLDTRGGASRLLDGAPRGSTPSAPAPVPV